MKKNCHIVGIGLIIMILIPSMAYLFTNTISDIKFNDENPTEFTLCLKSSVSGSLNLTYNDYYTFYWFAANKIEWNFTGDPINISIFLLILDENTYYYSFINDTINYGLNITLHYLYFDYIVSMNTSSNSGTYYPPQPDYWYVVFVNFDVIHQSNTIITFKIDFDPYDPDPNYVILPSFSLLNIFFIIFASVIGIMISLMIYIGVKKRHSAYKIPMTSPYSYQPKTQPKDLYIKQPKEHQIKKTELIDLPIPKYCPYCGTQRDLDALYCHQCGSTLE